MTSEMTIDIIDVTSSELEQMDSIQVKLIRTAQQKKDELQRKLKKQLAECENLCYANRTQESTIISDLKRQYNSEFNYQVNVLREQLVFNLSLREPNTDPGTGGDSSGSSGGDGNGYVVDYNLSYIDRYIAVRDYYLTIEDPNERLALYAKDDVAADYLGSYYNYLFNYLVSLT